MTSQCPVGLMKPKENLTTFIVLHSSGMVGPAAASQVLRRQTMGAHADAEEPEENMMIPECLRIFPRESEIERDIQLKNLLGRQVLHPLLVVKQSDSS